jgi:hypothetical protein
VDNAKAATAKAPSSNHPEGDQGAVTPSRPTSATKTQHEQEGQPDDGKEEPDPALEREDFGLEFLVVQRSDLGRDDGTRATANPACDGRSRYTEVVEHAWVIFFVDEVAKSVVVGAATGGGWHA